MQHVKAPTRRSFLVGAAKTAVWLATPVCAVAQASGGSEQPQHNAQTVSANAGTKFTASGAVLPFAGNTVIAHLPPQGDFRDAVVALHDHLAKEPCSAKLGMLPTDSYHMTIFSGANDQNRQASAWPSDVPLRASLQVCNQALNARFDKATVRASVPLQVKLDEEATMTYEHACSLRMQGANATAERNLRSIRDQLADIYKNRPADHDQYEFHITIAYTVSNFTLEETRRYRSLLAEHIPLLRAAAPILELGPPEFCTFTDMYRYNPLKMIRCS